MENKVRKYIIIIILVIIFYSITNFILLVAERSANSLVIQKYSDTIWYFFVTITSVGYGDIVPVSNLGKIIGFVYIISSLLLLGIIISSLASNIFSMIEERKLGYGGTKFTNHIICIGWNDFSRMVVDEVIMANRKVAIVTNNKDNVDLIYSQYGKENLFVLFADYHNFEVIKNTNPNESSEVFLAFENDTESLTYIINFHKIYTNPNIVVAVKNHKLRETFYAAGAKHVVAHNEIASKLVASYVFEPDVASLNIDLMSSATHDEDFDNQQYKVINQNPFLNKSYCEAFHKLKDDYNVVLLGLSKIIDGKYDLIINPKDKTLKIELNDYLIMMVSGNTKEKIEEIFGISEGIV